MRAVNLLPVDLETRRFEAGRLPVLVAGGGIAAVTAAAAVLFIGASGSVSDQRAQLESVEAALARIPAQGQKSAVAPGTIAQERSDRVTALAAALTTRVPVDRLLGELAYVLPEDAWLTGLTASAPTAATAAAPGAAPGVAATPGITIQGATYSHESVARVLARLAALPTLTNVRLSASARVEPVAPEGDSKSKTARKQKTFVTFTVTAGFRASGASA
jgi:Tfp pilus assembly protein PilN